MVSERQVSPRERLPARVAFLRETFSRQQLSDALVELFEREQGPTADVGP